jgi:hypothetical protein
MSGLDKNRFRNQTICFRATYQERRAIEERIAVSGMPKGQYYLQSLLHQKIVITVGKFESDKLSLEIRRIREALMSVETDHDDLYAALVDCRALMEQLIDVLESNYSDMSHKVGVSSKNNQMPLP